MEWFYPVFRKTTLIGQYVDRSVCRSHIDRWTGQCPILAYTTWRDLNQSQPHILIRGITIIIAEHAAARKISKYSSLPASRIFQPLALETLGLINSSGISFLVEVGRRLTDVSGDVRETLYLFTLWVSLAVQRDNSAAFKGTFTVSTQLD